MVTGKRQLIAPYMREHFRSDISIGEVARNLDMSESHLRAEFIKETGKAPLQYLTELRMAHALDLLRKRKYSIQEVARQVGIPSRMRFRRTFERYFGFAPSRFRPEDSEEKVVVALGGFKFTPPIHVESHPDAQIEAMWHARMDRCSTEYAQLLGAEKPTDVIGVTLREIIADTENTIQRHRHLIANGYDLTGVFGHIQGNGNVVPVKIDIHGVVRDGALVQTWGSAVRLDEDENVTSENAW